jgi:Lrp/AsnC family transcriptional regulator
LKVAQIFSQFKLSLVQKSGKSLTDAADQVDAYDIAILAVLQEDASLTVAQVAERANLSQNACWRRIRRLEEEGFVRKRVALLDAGKLRAGVTVFVTVRAAEHSEAWLAAFAAAVSRFPEVVEFYRMSGETDYLIKLQVEDIPAYDRVYKRLIRSVRLSDVSSAFAMEELKHTTAIPLPGRGAC